MAIEDPEIGFITNPEEEPIKDISDIEEFENVEFEGLIEAFNKLEPDDEEEGHLLLSRELNDDWVYNIYGSKTAEGGAVGLEFKLAFRGHSQAGLSFYEHNGVLELFDRQVDTKNQGVSGSMFLAKAEEAIQKLMQSGGINPEVPLGIDAGQIPVINWARKNGYEFESEEDKELYESILQGNPDYETGVTLVDDLGWEREDYILPKDVADVKDKAEELGYPLEYMKAPQRFWLFKKLG